MASSTYSAPGPDKNPHVHEMLDVLAEIDEAVQRAPEGKLTNAELNGFKAKLRFYFEILKFPSDMMDGMIDSALKGGAQNRQTIMAMKRLNPDFAYDYIPTAEVYALLHDDYAPRIKNISKDYKRKVRSVMYGPVAEPKTDPGLAKSRFHSFLHAHGEHTFWGGALRHMLGAKGVEFIMGHQMTSPKVDVPKKSNPDEKSEVKKNEPKKKEGDAEIPVHTAA